MDESTSASEGATYCPQAFEGKSRRCGVIIADKHFFYRTFLQFVLNIIREPTQLIHFRLRVVNECQRILAQADGLSKPPVTHDFRQVSLTELQSTWCALSLATDRYFEDKAFAYAWSAANKQLIKAGWYKLIGPALLPSAVSKKLEISNIRAWSSDFLELHQARPDPSVFATRCLNNCAYCYEVTHFLDQQEGLQFESCMSRAEPTESIAWLSNSLAERFSGGANPLLSCCFANNWLMHQDFSIDDQKEFMRIVRNRLDEQYARPIQF